MFAVWEHDNFWCRHSSIVGIFSNENFKLNGLAGTDINRKLQLIAKEAHDTYFQKKGRSLISGTCIFLSHNGTVKIHR